MSIKQLSYHTALTPGSDLWVLSEKQHSFWTQKIDWYLNFQISRKFPHIKLSQDQIKKLTNEWELPHFKPNLGNKDKVLMIASESFLPNTKTIILPFIKKNLTSWVCEVLKIWENIKYPSLRLFLPNDQYYEKTDYTKAIDQLPSTTTTEISFVQFKSQRLESHRPTK